MDLSEFHFNMGTFTVDPEEKDDSISAVTAPLWKERHNKSTSRSRLSYKAVAHPAHVKLASSLPSLPSNLRMLSADDALKTYALSTHFVLAFQNNANRKTTTVHRQADYYGVFSYEHWKAVFPTSFITRLRYLPEIMKLHELLPERQKKLDELLLQTMKILSDYKVELAEPAVIEMMNRETLTLPDISKENARQRIRNVHRDYQQVKQHYGEKLSVAERVAELTLNYEKDLLVATGVDDTILPSDERRQYPSKMNEWNLRREVGQNRFEAFKFMNPSIHGRHLPVFLLHINSELNPREVLNRLEFQIHAPTFLNAIDKTLACYLSIGPFHREKTKSEFFDDLFIDLPGANNWWRTNYVTVAELLGLDVLSAIFMLTQPRNFTCYQFMAHLRPYLSEVPLRLQARFERLLNIKVQDVDLSRMFTETNENKEQYVDAHFQPHTKELTDMTNFGTVWKSFENSVSAFTTETAKSQAKRLLRYPLGSVEKNIPSSLSEVYDIEQLTFRRVITSHDLEGNARTFELTESKRLPFNMSVQTYERMERLKLRNVLQIPSTLYSQEYLVPFYARRDFFDFRAFFATNPHTVNMHFVRERVHVLHSIEDVFHTMYRSMDLLQDSWSNFERGNGEVKSRFDEDEDMEREYSPWDLAVHDPTKENPITNWQMHMDKIFNCLDIIDGHLRHGSFSGNFIRAHFHNAYMNIRYQLIMLFYFESKRDVSLPVPLKQRGYAYRNSGFIPRFTEQQFLQLTQKITNGQRDFPLLSRINEPAIRRIVQYATSDSDPLVHGFSVYDTAFPEFNVYDGVMFQAQLELLRLIPVIHYETQPSILGSDNLARYTELPFTHLQINSNSHFAQKRNDFLKQVIAISFEHQDFVLFHEVITEFQLQMPDINIFYSAFYENERKGSLDAAIQHFTPYESMFLHWTLKVFLMGNYSNDSNPLLTVGYFWKIAARQSIGRRIISTPTTMCWDRIGCLPKSFDPFVSIDFSQCVNKDLDSAQYGSNSNSAMDFISNPFQTVSKEYESMYGIVFENHMKIRNRILDYERPDQITRDFPSKATAKDMMKLTENFMYLPTRYKRLTIELRMMLLLWYALRLHVGDLKISDFKGLSLDGLATIFLTSPFALACILYFNRLPLYKFAYEVLTENYNLSGLQLFSSQVFMQDLGNDMSLLLDSPVTTTQLVFDDVHVTYQCALLPSIVSMAVPIFAHVKLDLQQVFHLTKSSQAVQGQRFLVYVHESDTNLWRNPKMLWWVIRRELWELQREKNYPEVAIADMSVYLHFLLSMKCCVMPELAEAVILYFTAVEQKEDDGLTSELKKLAKMWPNTNCYTFIDRDDRRIEVPLYASSKKPPAMKTNFTERVIVTGDWRKFHYRTNSQPEKKMTELIIRKHDSEFEHTFAKACIDRVWAAVNRNTNKTNFLQFLHGMVQDVRGGKQHKTMPFYEAIDLICSHNVWYRGSPSRRAATQGFRTQAFASHGYDDFDAKLVIDNLYRSEYETIDTEIDLCGESMFILMLLYLAHTVSIVPSAQWEAGCNALTTLIAQMGTSETVMKAARYLCLRLIFANRTAPVPRGTLVLDMDDVLVSHGIGVARVSMMYKSRIALFAHAPVLQYLLSVDKSINSGVSTDLYAKIGQFRGEHNVDIVDRVVQFAFTNDFNATTFQVDRATAGNYEGLMARLYDGAFVCEVVEELAKLCVHMLLICCSDISWRSFLTVFELFNMAFKKRGQEQSEARRVRCIETVERELSKIRSYLMETPFVMTTVHNDGLRFSIIDRKDKSAVKYLIPAKIQNVEGVSWFVTKSN